MYPFKGFHIYTYFPENNIVFNAPWKVISIRNIPKCTIKVQYQSLPNIAALQKINSNINTILSEPILKICVIYVYIL